MNTTETMNTKQEYIKGASQQFNKAALEIVKAARYLSAAKDPELSPVIFNTKAVIGDLVISTVELNELSEKNEAEETKASEAK